MYAIINYSTPALYFIDESNKQSVQIKSNQIKSDQIRSDQTYFKCKLEFENVNLIMA